MNYTLEAGAKPGAKRSLWAGLKKLAPVMEGEKAGLVKAAIAIVINAGAALTAPSLRVRLVGAALGAAVPLGIALAYRRWRGQDGLGMGDVKMLAMMGATTGSAHMLLSLMLATFAGAAVGIVLLTLDGRSLQRPLPFGTFLSLAGLVSLVSGDAIIRWYLGLML